MATPIQGAQVAQQAQQTSPKEAQAQKVQDSKFDGVMANKANQAQQVGQIQQAGQVQKAQGVTQAQKVGEVAKAEKAKLDKTTAVSDKAVQGAKKDEGPQSVISRALGELESGQAQMEKMMQMALGQGPGGKKLDNQQLMLLQMQVYQYGQQMDLTSKVVEKATSGLKDTLKTQV